MSKLHKFSLQFGLLALAVVTVFLITTPRVFAAVPTDASPITTNSNVYTSNSNPTLVPKNSKVNGTALTTNSVTVASVYANNLSSSGRITKNTTKIYVQYNGQLRAGGTTTITKGTAVPELMLASGTKIPTSNTIASKNPNGNVQSVSFASTTYVEFDVDLSNIRESMPMLIGFSYQVSNGTAANTFASAQITTDSTVIANWEVSSPTVTEVTPAGNNPNGIVENFNGATISDLMKYTTVKVTATTISGKAAIGGLDMVLAWRRPGEQYRYKTTADANGFYTFKLDQPIGALMGSDTFTGSIFEINEVGDNASRTLRTKKVLSISNDKSDLSLTPDELSDTITGKSDSDIIAWLVKAAGVKSTYLDGANIADTGEPADVSNVTYQADQSGLADKISSLADGSSIDIKLTSTGTVTFGTSSSSGVASDGGVTIKVVKDGGILQFGDISPKMTFPDQALPTKETLISPNAGTAVNVEDTRAAGSDWSLRAEATPLVSADGNHTLKGGMVYVDAAGHQTDLTNNNTLIESGTRTKGVNSLDAAKGWASSSDDTKTGLYLNVKPSTYTGETTEYDGTIQWTLYNTPDGS